MITFNYETQFKVWNEKALAEWIEKVISAEKCKVGDINVIFCEDEYLHKLNVDYLKHDTLTDIISFDYSVGKELHGDVYISIERVYENAKDYQVSFADELHRVIIHGILHYCGYKDKSDEDTKEMRSRENRYLAQLELV